MPIWGKSALLASIMASRVAESGLPLTERVSAARLGIGACESRTKGQVACFGLASGLKIGPPIFYLAVRNLVNILEDYVTSKTAKSGLFRFTF